MARSATLQAARLALGGAAVLSPAQAAELLPWDSDEARAWLDEAGLVRRLPVTGRDGKRRIVRVVVWGDVVARLSVPEEPEVEERPRGRGTLARGGL